MFQTLRTVGFVLMLVVFGASSARAADPVAFVQSLGDKAVSILSDKTLAPVQKNEKFQTMLRESFDLATIARFVIGRSWNSATPEQQKEYMDLFEKMVVKTYSDRFALYTGEGFAAKSARAQGERDFLVNSQITHPDGSAATQVDWLIRVKGDKMGVIDVVVEGVGMSVTQHQEFAAIIQRDGGNIAGLLKDMANRVGDTSKAVPAK